MSLGSVSTVEIFFLTWAVLLFKILNFVTLGSLLVKKEFKVLLLLKRFVDDYQFLRTKIVEKVDTAN